MKDMAKKKKKNGLFRSERNEDQVERPLPAESKAEDTDTDLDINELLRKYMPEYRTDGDGDGELRLGETADFYPASSGDSSDPAEDGDPLGLGKNETAEDTPAEDLLAALFSSESEAEPEGSVLFPPEETAEEVPALRTLPTDTDGDALFSEDSSDASEESGAPVSEAAEGDAGLTQPQDLTDDTAEEAARSETEGGFVSGLVGRWAAAMHSEPEKQETAEEAENAPLWEDENSLFSRIVREAEEDSRQEDSRQGDVFSRIRQTVEEEEARKEEQARSDEKLLSALDSAFAYPAEDTPDGGDFQIPVSERPLNFGTEENNAAPEEPMIPDDVPGMPEDESADSAEVPQPAAEDTLIREYEFEDESQKPVSEKEETGSEFTASDTNAGTTDSDRMDFDDGSWAPEAQETAKKPVGEEMSDEQVLGLFGEVKPPKKKFSLFHRNKKPKVIRADDELLPDDGFLGSFGAAKAQTSEPEEPEGIAPEPDSEPWTAAQGTEEEFQPTAAQEEVPPQTDEPIPADEDTDALIAEATAAIFGSRRRKTEAADRTGSAEDDSAPEAESASQDEIPAEVWQTLIGGESPESAPSEEAGQADTDGTAEARREEPQDSAAEGSDTDFSRLLDSLWQSVSENTQELEDVPAADGTPSAEADKPEEPATESSAAADQPEPSREEAADQPDSAWEDTADALLNAAGNIPAAFSDLPSAGAKPEKAEPAPAKERKVQVDPVEARPFSKQSRRSATNLSDEELLRWAAETLAETQTSHDFDSEPDQPDGTPAKESAYVPVTETSFESAPAEEDSGEEIPDAAAFDGSETAFEDGDRPEKDSADGTDPDSYKTDADGSKEASGWQAPDTPYEEEEFDPTDINLMVAFDLDDGHGGKSGKAKALGDKLAARQQNRDVTVRLDRPEFVDRTQIPSIRKEYEKRSLSLFIRLIFCVVFGVVLFLFENIEPLTKLFTGSGKQFAGIFDPQVYPAVYAMTSLQLMLFCCLAAYNEIASGLKALFTGTPKPESMTAVLAGAGIVYSLVISRVTQPPEEPRMFNFIVAFACFMSLISAVYQNKREMMNFRIVSSKKTKHIVRRLKDDESELETKAFAGSEDVCDVMKIEKTDFIDGFFGRLQRPDQTTGTFMMFVMGATVLIAVAVGIIDRIRGGTSANVARAMYESLLMIAPLSIFISFSYPFYRANLTAKEYDSAIIGETSLDEYSNASIISFDDKNVFPSYSVKVQNVRIYNNARIDRVLYYASSVFACAGGPLQDVFEDVTKDLGTSSNVKIFETGDGFLATQVDGVNIIFGSCDKLRERGFVIEDTAAEDDVDLSDELSIMYMFRENKLVAKMYIKYEMDPDIDSILKQFSGNGLYACVRTFDPNICEDMVAKKLSMKNMPLKVVRYADLDDVATYEAKVDAGLVTCGQQKSLLQVISYCGKVLRTKKTHIALSVLAVIITASIVTILELANLLTGMNSLLITLYQLIWLVPTMITSRVFIR